MTQTGLSIHPQSEPESFRGTHIAPLSPDCSFCGSHAVPVRPALTGGIRKHRVFKNKAEYGDKIRRLIRPEKGLDRQDKGQQFYPDGFQLKRAVREEKHRPETEREFHRNVCECEEKDEPQG